MPMYYQIVSSRSGKIGQNILLPKKWVWSRIVQRPCFINCPFIEKNLKDVMFHHFQIEIQTKLEMEEGQNLMVVPQNTID
jgi:hypothetical protein